MESGNEQIGMMRLPRT